MIRRLLLLNGVAILGVILFHAGGWSIVALLDWSQAYGATPAEQVETYAYPMLRFIEQLVVFSIPAFLFVSGFFIAFATGKHRKTISWHVIGIRIRDLIIPYTIWTLILWGALIFESVVLGNRNLSLIDFPIMYVTGRTNPAYYYVPLLIQFYLLSPFLVRWAKAGPWSLLVVAGIVQLLVQLQYYPALIGWDVGAADFIPKWLFVTRIFWFSLGLVIGFNIKPFQEWVVRRRLWFLLLALVLLPLGMFEWRMMQEMSGQLWLPHRETFLDSVYSIAVIFAFLGYYRVKIPASRQLDDLGSKSFGIYLVHSPVMEYTARAIFILVPALLAFQAVFLAIMVVVGLGVPLLLMGAVNRSPLRIYYKYIFG